MTATKRGRTHQTFSTVQTCQLNDKDIWSVLLGGEKKQKAELDQEEREFLGNAHLYSHNST